MIRRMALTVAVCFVLAAAALPVGAAAADRPPRVTTEQLKSWLGDPAVSIVDARAKSDWEREDRKIPGSIRRDPSEVDTWATDYGKDRTLVVYCA